MKSIKKLKKSSGFTLIEILTTVVVMGVLTSFAYPMYINYVIKGQINEGTLLFNEAKLMGLNYLDKTNKFPENNNEINYHPVGNYVSKIETSGDTNKFFIKITYSGKAPFQANSKIDGGVITYMGVRSSSGIISWSCDIDGQIITKSLAPSICDGNIFEETPSAPPVTTPPTEEGRPPIDPNPPVEEKPTPPIDIVNPDGSVTHPDGSTNYPDGTIKYPNGETHYPNGDIKDNLGNIKHPDGSITIPDGNTVFPDGTIKYPNGDIKDVNGNITHADGSVTRPDGSIKYPNGDIKDKDGNITHQDGSVTKPDGSTKYPDGSIKYPNGDIKYPNGSVGHPDGSVTNPDTSTTLPNGKIVLTTEQIKKYPSISNAINGYNNSLDRYNRDIAGIETNEKSLSVSQVVLDSYNAKIAAISDQNEKNKIINSQGYNDAKNQVNQAKSNLNQFNNDLKNAIIEIQNQIKNYNNQVADYKRNVSSVLPTDFPQTPSVPARN